MANKLEDFIRASFARGHNADDITMFLVIAEAIHKEPEVIRSRYDSLLQDVKGVLATARRQK
jgi:hypothetical protein